MEKDEVIKFVLKSESLPTLPAVAWKLVSISSQEEIGMKEIANLVSKDASLSAKVLKIANSALYNFPVKINNVHQAASRIGLNAIRSLVLSFSFLSMKVKNGKDIFDYEKFWERSLSNAVAAKLIVTESGKFNGEEVFIAGLLQDIGVLIVASCFPQEYARLLTETTNGEKDTIEMEEHIIGADHACIGYEVTKRWGFPPELSIPIYYHHRPHDYKGNDNKHRFAINVVYLSGIFANILCSNNPKWYHQRFLEVSKETFGFDEKVVSRILEHAITEINQTTALFGLHTKEYKSIEEILQEANTSLSSINLTYDQINRELVDTKERLQKLTKELEEKNKHLEKLAQLDSLTEVYNHGCFQKMLGNQVSLATRNILPLSLIMLDIDNFKNFNDNYGHPVGDAILKELCTLMKKSLRDYDMLFRYGGEEFAILLIDTSDRDAWFMAERLRESIAGHTFIIHNHKYNVTASFGVAGIIPALDDLTKKDLIVFADAALFESKKAGRNKVTVYDQKKYLLAQPL
ncbi:MAG: HDOD domain-containing protein [Candidatus Brocadiaceae bacterium]|nr:HDOD domain-containing protein [Candidatus Brocadiaceae bacterium]